jgi:NADH dehydrogenase FAD-containing subunit
MFDASLANYALNVFRRDGISVRTSHHILSLKKGLPGMSPEDPDSMAGFTLTTQENGETGVGMVVWSTGLMMNPFVQKALNSVRTYPVDSIALPTNASLSPTGLTPQNYRWVLKRHPKSGGLMVDSKFRLQLVSQPDKPGDSAASMSATMKDVFALGDVAVLSTGQLPATAQVANQEAKWLAQRLNKGDLDYRSFSFKNLGMMAFLGGTKAIMQTGDNKEVKGYV